MAKPVRRAWVPSALTLVMSLSGSGPLAGQTSYRSSHLVDHLGWLAGCWEMGSGARVVEEQWTRPRGGVMLGAGRTMQGDSLVEYEQVRLLQRGGRLVYAAAPSGQPPAEFESTAVTDTSVSFENPSHDFPQRISYRKVGADSLVARVEGMRGGKLRGRDFAYRRAACP
jgi:Domain of unknown function (DUF6265)